MKRILFSIVCISLILASFAKADVSDKNAQLLQAANDGNLPAVQTALAEGAKVNAKDKNGATGLWLASSNDHTKVVKVLLERGADVNVKATTYGITVLMVASLKGHTEVIKLLLANGVEVNAKDKNGTTALWMASEEGYMEVVKLLLEKGADVNVKKTDTGTTALWMASQKGHTEVVKLLLEKGADVNAKATDGATTLWEASQNGHTEVVKLLLEKGADVNVKTTDNGSTALMMASKEGHTEVVKLLLEKGTDVNVKTTDNGVTPLFIASVAGHTEVVKLLLAAKADVNIRVNDGNTPLSIAKKMGHTQIIELLEGANAGSVQYVQTGYPIYKLVGGNAAMLSETYLAKTRTIEADAEIDVARLAQDDLGASIPAECKKYAEDMGSRFAIAVKGKAETKCDLMFQDVAYLKTDKGKHPVMILGYKGCPFSVRELKVLSDISMREPMTVEIASADGYILRAEAASALPFIVASESTTPSFMAANVQWRFATAGMSFSTTKATYKTSKSGATISFTETGVKLDGVEEISKAGNAIGVNQLDLVEGAKGEITHVMRKHVDGMKAMSVNKLGYSVTEKRWEKLFSQDAMTFTTDAALRLADEAIRDGKHHVESKIFDTIYIAVSVVPSIEDKKSMTLFPGGYFQVLDGLLKESGWLQSDRDFAHWIYCYEGKDKHKVHLTFIPAKSLSSGSNVWIFAQDLMTSDEKARAGVK